MFFFNYVVNKLSHESKKVSMAKSLPVENLLPPNKGSTINCLEKSTEVAQLGSPGCSHPQPAADNGVRDG